jgi:hypothetical protein
LLGGSFRHNSGARRGEKAELYIAVIASAAKQSILFSLLWIASLRPQ